MIRGDNQPAPAALADRPSLPLPSNLGQPARRALAGAGHTRLDQLAAVVSAFVTLDSVMEVPDRWSFPPWNAAAAQVKADELFASDALPRALRCNRARFVSRGRAVGRWSPE